MAQNPTKKSKKSVRRKKAKTLKSGASKPRKESKTAPKPKEAADKDKCFVMSPFGGWHDDYYLDVFCPAIKSAGLDPGRADDLFRSSNIVHDIWAAVSSSRVLLADLTNKNPNVFYELGLAHAARKPVLLLTQSIEDVPFDLRALRVIEYDVEHPAWGKRLRENIKQGLEETLESPEASVLPTFLLESHDGHPEVSKDEARFISLQQQLDSLRAEFRDTGMRNAGKRERIDPPEARRMIRRLVAEGMPRGMIVNRVSARGAPKPWVREELDSIHADAPESLD